MDRSIEIINILRSGLESIIADEPDIQIHYTRMFNFSERRVSIRMEVSNEQSVRTPMGRIDVVEIPSKMER